MYGGTFDPPHEGHRNLVDAAFKETAFDRLLLIPSYIPPHKAHSPALPFETRKGLLLDCFGDLPGVEVLDIEQKREGKSYTIDTIHQLEAVYPNGELHFLMGSDMFLSFENWRCFEELLEKLILVVSSREKGDLSQLKAHREMLMREYDCKGIILCNQEPVICSSSAMRELGGGLAGRIYRHIGEALDAKRACHTFRVAEYARQLAFKSGLDPEKAYLAGLLHDATRCYSEEWHRGYIQKHQIPVSSVDLQYPHILHQYTGAKFAEEELGVDDPVILNAIQCHTTGKEQMEPFDMLVFFADSCEPGRNYPDVEELRRLGEQDLKKGTLAVLEHTTAFLIEKGSPVHPRTAAAQMHLQKELNENE